MNVYYCRLITNRLTQHAIYELYVHADSVLEALLYLEGRHDLPKGEWMIECVHNGSDDIDRGDIL